MAVVAAIACTSGCATPFPHAELPRAPTRDDGYEVRAAYFKSYVLDSREGNHLFLHGGTRVYWPEDLLPAIDDSSPSALAIREHVEARQKAEQWSWLGTTGAMTMSLGMVSLVGMLVPLALPIAESDKSTAVIVIGAGSIAGLGVGLGLGIVHVLIVGDDESRASEAADRAARTYPQALSDRLAIGADADGRIVDQVIPAVAAPPTSKQSL